MSTTVKNRDRWIGLPPAVGLRSAPSGKACPACCWPRTPRRVCEGDHAPTKASEGDHRSCSLACSLSGVLSSARYKWKMCALLRRRARDRVRVKHACKMAHLLFSPPAITATRTRASMGLVHCWRLREHRLHPATSALCWRLLCLFVGLAFGPWSGRLTNVRGTPAQAAARAIPHHHFN